MEYVRPASRRRIEATNASASARERRSQQSARAVPTALTSKPSGPVGVTTYGIRPRWHETSAVALYRPPDSGLGPSDGWDKDPHRELAASNEPAVRRAVLRRGLGRSGGLAAGYASV